MPSQSLLDLPTLALAGSIVAAGLVSAVAHGASYPRAAATLKMAAATGYLLLALTGGAMESGYGRTLMVALTLCWLGDLLLIRGGKGAAFLGGLVAFLLGHVAFAVAFGASGVALRWVAVSAVPVTLLGGAVLLWLWRHDVSQGMRAPVATYVAAITVMVSWAWGAAGAGAPWIVPVGAMLFMVSDIFVARERFVSSSPLNTRLGLPLYFLAQVLLALSV